MTRSRLISSHVNHYTQTSYHLSLLYLVRSHFRSHDQSSDPDMLPYLISDPSRRSALVSRKLFLFSLAPNIRIELRCSSLFCFLQERRFRLSICQVHSFMNCRECAHLRPSHEGFSTFFFFDSIADGGSSGNYRYQCQGSLLDIEVVGVFAYYNLVLYTRRF